MSVEKAWQMECCVGEMWNCSLWQEKWKGNTLDSLREAAEKWVLQPPCPPICATFGGNLSMRRKPRRSQGEHANPMLAVSEAWWERFTISKFIDTWKFISIFHLLFDAMQATIFTTGSTTEPFSVETAVEAPLFQHFSWSALLHQTTCSSGATLLMGNSSTFGDHIPELRLLQTSVVKLFMHWSSTLSLMFSLTYMGRWRFYSKSTGQRSYTNFILLYHTPLR